MPPEGVARWLHHARGDLALAEVRGLPGVPLELLCFHAQQATEKALKALLVAQGETVPRTHDLGLLLEQVERHHPLPEGLRRASRLTDYAVWTRYPGDVEPVTEEEYAEAVAATREVLAWVEALLGRR